MFKLKLIFILLSFFLGSLFFTPIKRLNFNRKKLDFLSIHIVFSNNHLYAQEYEDDDEEDEYDEEEQESQVEEKKAEVKKVIKEKYIDDDDEEEDSEEEEQKEVKKIEKVEKKEVIKKQDKIKTEKSISTEKKEEVKPKQSQEEDSNASSEKRLREAKEKEAKRRSLKKEQRLQERKKQILYIQYYENYMKKNKIFSKVPGRSGLAVSFNLGFQPNLGNSVYEGFTFGSHLQSSRASEYLTTRYNKGISEIANAFAVQIDDKNKTITDGSSKVVYDKSSSGIYSFPLGINATYYQKHFLLRMGIQYHNSIIGLGGTNRMTLKNDETGGEDYIEHQGSMQRLEVPLSIALKFLYSKSYGAYLGTGIDLFWGNNSSTVTSYNDSLQLTITEEDSYSGFGFGFHFLLGIEAEIRDRTYLVVELFQNFGYSSLITDSKINEGSESYTGTSEGDQPDKIQINFSGTEILVGLRYFL